VSLFGASGTGSAGLFFQLSFLPVINAAIGILFSVCVSVHA